MTCYKKPNRTKPRYFTAKDVARISRYATKSGVSAQMVIVSVIVALGAGALVCKVAKALSNFLNILNFVGKMGGVLAMSAFIERIIFILSYGKLLPHPAIRGAAIGLIAVFAFVQGMLEAISNVYSDYSTLKEVSDTLSAWCALVDNIEDL